MGTYDYTKGSGGANPYSGHKVSVVERVLDFAEIAAARAAASQAALAADDVLQVIPVKAGQFAQLALAEVITAEGETATLEVGDGADPNGFLDAVNANATGQSASLATTAYSVAVGGGKLYTADDTIDVALRTAAFNVAKIRLVAVVVDLRRENLE
jgi:hypothetical protein